VVNDCENIVDKIWENKPCYSKKPVIIHEIEFSGESCAQKYKRVKNTLLTKNKDIKDDKIALFITRLDDIAWLTNLRGSDISYNPVFFSFAILYFDGEKEHLTLFVDQDKFNSDVHKQHLKDNNIILFSYDDVYSKLASETEGFLLIADKESMNQNIYESIKKNMKEDQFKIIESDAVEYTKHIKTERELKGLRECNIRDGAALVNYFAWLEKELEKRDNLTEYEAAVKSAEFRSKQSRFMGESFAPISSTGPNAAIIHYKPDEKESSIIKKDQIYLLDSGGQYV
jgi:Xaa-Pro aminopeptidase